MIKIKGFVLLCVILSLASCATNRNTDVVRQSVDQGLIKGISKDTKFSLVVAGLAVGKKGVKAGNIGDRPYSKIDDLSAKVLDGEHKDRSVTFFLGKSNETGEWEVFAAMVEADGKWLQLPVKLQE